MKKTVTISTTEYEELKNYRDAFQDLCDLKKKAGSAYQNYERLRSMDAFFKERYASQYSIMVKNYEEYSKWNSY